MEDILKKIIISKKKFLKKKSDYFNNIFKSQIPPCQENFFEYLKKKDFFIISEVKKCSPSKGVISYSFDPVKRALIYERGGTDVISVLTEEDYFCGSLDHLRIVCQAVKIPVLCKDFIIDEKQIAVARSLGASTFLLIARILSPKVIKKFINIGRDLNMEPIVEVNSMADIETSVNSGSKIIGINTRDLESFAIDSNKIKTLKDHIPSRCIIIGESGIMSKADLLLYKKNGVNGVLIGEYLMRSKNPYNLLKELKNI